MTLISWLEAFYYALNIPAVNKENAAVETISVVMRMSVLDFGTNSKATSGREEKTHLTCLTVSTVYLYAL